MLLTVVVAPSPGSVGGFVVLDDDIVAAPSIVVVSLGVVVPIASGVVVATVSVGVVVAIVSLGVVVAIASLGVLVAIVHVTDDVCSVVGIVVVEGRGGTTLREHCQTN